MGIVEGPLSSSDLEKEKEKIVKNIESSGSVHVGKDHFVNLFRIHLSSQK